MSILQDELVSILKRGGVVDTVNESSRILKAAQLTAQNDISGLARDMAERRASGTPLAFVIGHEEFMDVDLVVAEGALAPREETELLGNTALEVIRSFGSVSPRVIDMCCGSGNLACAIAHHIQTASVWASDLTDGCIAVARQNVDHVSVSDRVAVAQGDLFSGLDDYDLEGSIDIVVCNPPYISQGKLATDRSELLEHEPREAFDGGPYGLTIQQRVIKEALPFLRPHGILMFEIGLGQEKQVKMLFERSAAYDDIKLISNLKGEVRVVSGRKKLV